MIEVRGGDPAALAGKDSELHQHHKVYLDIVTVASVPENYESRLLDLVPEEFERLRLKSSSRAILFWQNFPGISTAIAKM